MIKATAIIPKMPNLSISDAADKVIRPTLRDIEREFNKFVATWSHQPTWTTTVKSTRSAIIGEYASDDRILRFVVRGTRVRYATMTPDFVPKTTPNVLKSGPGKGGLDYVDTRRPHPGLEARNTEEEVKKVVEPGFIKRADAYFKGVRRRSGHAI